MFESIISNICSQEIFLNLNGKYVNSILNKIKTEDIILVILRDSTKYIVIFSEKNDYQIFTIINEKAVLSSEVNLEEIINEDSIVSGYKCDLNIFSILLKKVYIENFNLIAEKIEWSLALELAKTEIEHTSIIFYFEDNQNMGVYFKQKSKLDETFLLLFNDKEILVNNEAKKYVNNNLSGQVCKCKMVKIEEENLEIKKQSKQLDEKKYDPLNYFLSKIQNSVSVFEQIKESINLFFKNQNYLGYNFTFKDQAIVENFSELTDFSEQFYKEYPENLQNIYFLITLYRSQENFEDELNIINQSRQYFSNNAEFIILASKIYDRNQLTTQSYQILKEALEKEEIDKLLVLEQLSSLYRKYQKHTDQIAVLDNIIELAKERNDINTLFKAHYDKALALVNLGRDSESIQYFETAISLNKYELGPYQNLASVAERTVNLESAISVLNRALENVEEKDKVFNLMGSLYVKNQMYQEALESYNNLIQIEPDDTSALLQIGTIYMLLGDEKTAKSYFEKVLEIDPEHIGAKNNLKSLLVNKKKKKKRTDSSEYDIITRKRYTMEEIIDLLPEETRKSLQEIEYDDFKFNKAEFNRLYFKAFSKGIGFSTRSAYFYEALKFAYKGQYLDGLLASAINYCAAYGLELSKVHRFYLEAFYYYGALFDLLAICTDIPINIKTFLSRHYKFFIRNINKFKNNLVNFFWSLLLTARDETASLELLYKKIQMMNPQHKIVQCFVDAVIDLYLNNDQDFSLTILSWNWPRTFREYYAFYVLSSFKGITLEDRRYLINLILGFEKETDKEILTTIGLLGTIADTFHNYRKDNISVQDKMSLHNRLLTDLMNLRKYIFTQLKNKKKSSIFYTIYKNLEIVIKQETEKIILYPEISFDLITKSIPLIEETEIVFCIKNDGSGPAQSLNLKINAKDGLMVLNYEEDLGIISSKQYSNFEVKVNPLKEGEFPIYFNLTYTNLKNETEVKEFTEVISIYSATDFQWIESPYITGLPVQSPEMFFGRQDTIEIILSKLRGVYQDNVLILHGQRRTGKTSILYQLKDYHLKKPYIPVLIDMQKLKSAETRRLCRKIAELTLDEFTNRKIKYREIERDKFSRNFEEDPIGALDDFFDDLNRILPDHKILILFDEFEGLIRNIIDGKVDKDFLDVMRGWMQHSKNVRFIITGADKLREMMENYWSPLFQIAEFITIGYLKENEARDLITRPVLGRLDYDENAVSKIINVTSSNPYYIQLICQKIIERMNYLKRKKVTVVDVDKVIEENLIPEGTYFDHLWEQSNEDEKIFLSCLSELSFSHEDWVRFDDLLSMLKKSNSPVLEESRFLLASRNLKNRGVIEQRDIEGELLFKIKIDLFRLRCKNYQPLSRVLREVPAYA